MTNLIGFHCEERIAIGVQRPTAVNIVTGLAANWLTPATGGDLYAYRSRTTTVLATIRKMALCRRFNRIRLTVSPGSVSPHRFRRRGCEGCN